MAEEDDNLVLREILLELKEIKKSAAGEAERNKTSSEESGSAYDEHIELLKESAKTQDKAGNLLPKHLRDALKENRKGEASDRKKEAGPRKVKEEEGPLGFLKEGLGKLYDKLDALGEPKEEKDKEKGGQSWLSKLLGPGAMLLLAGLGALVAAFAGFGGPFAGFIQSFGKWGTMGGIKLIGKTFAKMLGKIGKFLGKFLRRIPIVGGLISFGFAYMAFKEGDYLGGVLDIVSGILNLIPLGFTQVLSFGIDMFNAYLDYKNQPDESGKKPGKLNIIKEMCAPIWDFIKPYAYNIPILGTFLYASDAMTAFKAGEIGKGIWKMLGAFSTIIPFVGPLLFQGASALLGFTDEDFEEAKEGKPSKGIQMGKMLKDWAVGKIKKSWKKMPWWVQKPLRWALPDSVIKWLDGGDKPDEPEQEEPAEPAEPSPTSTEAKLNRDREKEGGKRLNKSTDDLEAMSTADLRNLRDEHGTDWANQDYDRIQKVIDDRMGGKKYDKKKKKDSDPKDAAEEAFAKYDKMFADFKGPSGRMKQVDWNKATQFDTPKLPKVAEGGLVESQSDISPKRMAEGGPVEGGSGVFDDIPALLQGGEFVMSKESVDLQGESFFDNLNKKNAEGNVMAQASDLAKENINTDMLDQLKQNNEFQQQRMQQQAKSDTIQQQQLAATKQLLAAKPTPNITSVSNNNVNMGAGSSIRAMRDFADGGKRRR